jgi:hypothetical protein
VVEYRIPSITIDLVVFILGLLGKFSPSSLVFAFYAAVAIMWKFCAFFIRGKTEETLQKLILQ